MTLSKEEVEQIQRDAAAKPWMDQISRLNDLVWQLQRENAQLEAMRADYEKFKAVEPGTGTFKLPQESADLIDALELELPVSESDGMNTFERTAWKLCDRVRTLERELAQAQKERDEAKAEIERIRDQWNSEYRAIQGRYEASRAEAERLREANGRHAWNVINRICGVCGGGLDEPEGKCAGCLTDKIDLMRDEFQRIKACPSADSEIKGLCERAISDIHQHVPVIVQRDKAEADRDRLSAEAQALRETNEALEAKLIDADRTHLIRLLRDEIKALEAKLAAAKQRKGAI